jgi:UDP-N-acetylmuramate dehydrogenase
MSLNIEHDTPLSEHSNFKVGGPAKHFVTVSNIDELREAIKLSNDNSWPTFILAGGTNIIFSDNGFDGLVIKVDLRNYHIDGNKLTTDCGVSAQTLVDLSSQNGWGDLAWAGGLPGTIGGAVRGNAGAYGGETKDNVEQVISLDLKTGEKIVRNNQECQFGYRDSSFKRLGEVICHITLTFNQKIGVEAAQDIVNSHRQDRITKHPLDHPNVGSIFKNVPVDQLTPEINEKFAQYIKTDPFPVIPAARVIIDAGLVGKQVGDAQVSTKHSNFIVNLGHATAKDIISLIKAVQQEVQQKYQIDLEVEPQII